MSRVDASPYWTMTWLKPRCCPQEPQRKVTRSIFEPSRDMARAIAQTRHYAISCKLGKKVETSFAHLKRIQRLERLRFTPPKTSCPEKCPSRWWASGALAEIMADRARYWVSV